jgi:hypothetical protein
MARPANRTLLWALLVSLLLHFLMVGSVGRFWSMPTAELDFPIKAQLVSPAVKPPPAKPKPPPALRKVAPAPKMAIPQPLPKTPEQSPAPVSQPASPPSPEPLKPGVAEAAAKEAPTEPAIQIRPVVRDLPTDLTINYAVQLGDGDNGFVAGRATYIWHSGQGKYSMVSTVEATGLASFFIHGRIVQVSQGKVDGGGLRPEQYWLERSGRKVDGARFNWAMNRLILTGGEDGRPLQPQAQDLLSFPFQLALTVRPDESDFVLWVTNGRKFRDYTFHTLGQETVNLTATQTTALHLQGTRPGEGTLDVWLDLAKSGLPVRIRTRGEDGKTMVLRLESMSGAIAQASGD